jgi:hypothetical protein
MLLMFGSAGTGQLIEHLDPPVLVRNRYQGIVNSTDADRENKYFLSANEKADYR